MHHKFVMICLSYKCELLCLYCKYELNAINVSNGLRRFTLCKLRDNIKDIQGIG